MKYLTKNFRGLFNTASDMDCLYQKPAQCPHCGLGCDPAILKSSLISPFVAKHPRFVVLILQCTACEKLFTATYEVENNKSTLCCMTPEKPYVFSDSQLESISPRFIETYNQALRARHIGDLNLAACGYRTALEILVKDYAIKELKEPVDKVVPKTLFNAISDYLSADDLLRVADVIRILGNDHTHYERKYPELDFDTLQNYMNIFISLVKNKLLIAHPPVSRQPKA